MATKLLVALWAPPETTAWPTVPDVMQAQREGGPCPLPPKVERTAEGRWPSPGRSPAPEDAREAVQLRRCVRAHSHSRASRELSQGRRAWAWCS